jgi:hypothetical protein
MRSQLKWIGAGLPKRFAFKKDMPAHLQRQAVLVQFRFETAYIVRDENGLVLFDNGMGHCLDFYLRTPGHVIGLRDLETASQYEWAHEWRAAMHDRITERLALNP